MTNQYIFNVYDENLKPVYYSGTKIQMIHRADGESVDEAKEKAQSNFVKGVVLILKDNKDEQQLREVVLDTLEDIQRDEVLCAKYPNVCAYASSAAYKHRIVQAVVKLVANEGITDIFEAMAQVENSLFTDWTESTE